MPVSMEKVSDLLKRYLSKFECIINLEFLRTAEQTYRDVFTFKEVDELPYILADVSQAPDTDWPQFPYNDAFTDPAKMLLNELREPFLHHQLRDYLPINLRCNYGTVIMPSLFGIPYELTDSAGKGIMSFHQCAGAAIFLCSISRNRN